MSADICQNGNKALQNMEMRPGRKKISADSSPPLAVFAKFWANSAPLKDASELNWA
jgi:hypothetical protein